MEDHQYFNRSTISQKKVIEKIRDRNEELEHLLQAQKQLLLIISHDLRTPFSSILGFAGLLQERSEQFDEDTQRFIQSIHSQARLTFNLLSRLTDWARAQSDSFEVSCQKIDMSELVEEVLNPYAEAAALKNISVDYTDGGVVSLYADPEIIRIILSNLLSNAIKFTCPAGRIHIHSRKGDGLVEITVADNGVGISREKIANLFSAGREFSSAGTANEIGSGVGLSLSKELAMRLQGQIRVESELGKGSKFTVSFPEKSQ